MTSHTCDYHMHSTASDGALSPTELLTLAAERGLTEIALTDHDTFAGLEEARAAAQARGIRLLDGMEFSCVWSGMTIHLVALWLQGLNEGAQQVADVQEKARWRRAELIAEKLQKAGYPIALQQAIDKAGGHVPGRPHFAACLVEAGHFSDESQAFRKLLGSGKLCDVKNHWLPLTESVALLNAAGAVVIMAHPLRYKLTLSKRLRLLDTFTEAGGWGVEVVSGLQDTQQTASMLKYAETRQLVPSWGSDFHKSITNCYHPGHFSALPDACQPLSRYCQA